MTSYTKKTKLLVASIALFTGCSWLGQPSIAAAIVPPNYQLMTSPQEDTIDYGGGTSSHAISPIIWLIVFLSIIVAGGIFYWTKLSELMETSTLSVIRWLVAVSIVLFCVTTVGILIFGKLL